MSLGVSQCSMSVCARSWVLPANGRIRSSTEPTTNETLFRQPDGSSVKRVSICEVGIGWQLRDERDPAELGGRCLWLQAQEFGVSTGGKIRFKVTRQAVDESLEFLGTLTVESR